MGQRQYLNPDNNSKPYIIKKHPMHSLAYSGAYSGADYRVQIVIYRWNTTISPLQGGHWWHKLIFKYRNRVCITLWDSGWKFKGLKSRGIAVKLKKHYLHSFDAISAFNGNQFSIV